MIVVSIIMVLITTNIIMCCSGDTNGLDLLQYPDLAQGQGHRDGSRQCALGAQHQPFPAPSSGTTQVLPVRFL